MRYIFHCFLLISIAITNNACENTPSEDSTAQQADETTATSTENTSDRFPELLMEALTAHGGFDRWRSMKNMSFTVERKGSPEEHLIDLENRKVLLTHEDYKVGFDGQEVWVSPDKAAFGDGSARFYHNLRFYFVAMPFIVTDPGINYQVLPQKEIQGTTYNALRVTYDAGVGDAPEDEYILHFHPDSNQMEWLLYTVTYYSGEPSEKYNALHYSEWQEVNGLLMPQMMEGYTYQKGKIGEQRYERAIDDFQMTTDKPDQSLFMMPEEAEIDSLVSR